MHQKLLEVLRCLSAVELNHLEKFLESPYFNSNERLLQLFLFLKDFAPAFDDHQMDLESLFLLLYPEKEFDKQHLVRLNSQLFKLVETFISHERLTDNTFQREVECLRFYEERNLDKHFQSSFAQIKKKQEATFLRDMDFYEKNLALESIYSQYLGKKDQRKGDINLTQENECLDLYFIVRKFKQLTTMVNRQSLIRIDYELTLLEELLHYIEVKNLVRLPTIAIYKTILDLLLHPQEVQHYFALKSLLKEHHGLFSTDELRFFYTCLANTIQHVFSGKEYFQAFFELYQQQLKDNTLYHNDFILHTFFRNVTGAAIGVGAYDWAEEFIQSHHKRILPESIREDAFYQMLANLRYYQGQAAEALVCLQKSNPQDVYYKLSQKSLLVKIYFDLREVTALWNVLNNFTKTITDYKAKISETKVTSYRKFINFTKELLRILSTAESQIAFEQRRLIKDKNTLSALADLQLNVAESPMFYSKKWLLEKLEEFVP